MKRLPGSTIAAIAVAFVAGVLTYSLYLRWISSASQAPPTLSEAGNERAQTALLEPQNHPLTFKSPQASAERASERPVLAARDIERIRGLAGQRARIRGRIFRVGHSTKSNTYFLDFGPAREALTGVIFASAVELFEKSNLSPKTLEGKEVEIEGEIKDHPQYGLELILEDPSQIRLVQ
jgi:hypothetical protein